MKGLFIGDEEGIDYSLRLIFDHYLDLNEFSFRNLKFGICHVCKKKAELQPAVAHGEDRNILYESVIEVSKIDESELHKEHSVVYEGSDTVIDLPIAIFALNLHYKDQPDNFYYLCEECYPEYTKLEPNSWNKNYKNIANSVNRLFQQKDRNDPKYLLAKTIRKWFRNPQNLNSRMLVKYCELYLNNKNHIVTYKELENEFPGEESDLWKTFMKHQKEDTDDIYNKQIFESLNDGKVFLNESIREIVLHLYTKYIENFQDDNS